MMDGKLVGVPGTAAEQARAMERERATAQALATYGLTMELEAIRLAVLALAEPGRAGALERIVKSTQVAGTAGQAAMKALKAAGVHVTVKPQEEGGSG